MGSHALRKELGAGGGQGQVTYLGLLTHLSYPGSLTGQYSLGWKP